MKWATNDTSEEDCQKLGNNIPAVKVMRTPTLECVKQVRTLQ